MTFYINQTPSEAQERFKFALLQIANSTHFIHDATTRIKILSEVTKLMAVTKATEEKFDQWANLLEEQAHRRLVSIGDCLRQIGQESYLREPHWVSRRA